MQPNCEKCPLKETQRIHGHWCGKGDTEVTQADIVFVVGCPTQDDIKRKSFLNGDYGKLVRTLFTKLDIDPSRCYVTGAAECRVAKGKEPGVKIIRPCKDRLLEEITSLKPKLVIPMGDGATLALLGAGEGITKRRGIYTEVEANGMTLRVIPTHHPKHIVRVFETDMDDDKSKHAAENVIDLIHDLEYAKSILNGEPAIIEPPYDDYVIVDTQDMFDLLLERLATVELTSVDIETAGGDPEDIGLEDEDDAKGSGLDFQDGRILSVAFSWARGKAVAVDWTALLDNQVENLKRLSAVLSGVRCGYHHGQFDHLVLTEKGVHPWYVKDSMMQHYCLDERPGVHGLKRLSIDRYRAPSYGKEIPVAKLGEYWDDPEWRTRILLYNAADADFTFRLLEDQERDMAEESPRLQWVHDNILIPACKHFIELQRSGMLVDVRYVQDQSVALRSQLAEIEVKLRSYPGCQEMNFESPKQVATYLYETLALDPMPSSRKDKKLTQEDILAAIGQVEDEEAHDYWKTASSAIYKDMHQRSTNTYMLYYLAQQHQWARYLVKHRELAKTLGTYFEGTWNRMGWDCKVRPYFRVAGARTGRLASNNPNIHGMPKKKEIKDIYRAEPGWTLVHADYSQAEVRMMAHLAQDMRLIAALSESDIHLAVAMKLFNLSHEEWEAQAESVKKVRRRAAKTIVFGLIYGRSAKSLAPQIGCSVAEAEAYITRFFEEMPDVARYITEQRQLVLREREVESIFGRKRRFPLIVNKWHVGEVQRQAVNMPIQSSVSDMTLLANIRVMERLQEAGIPAKPWPHVHDAMIVQVPDHLVGQAVEIMKEEMLTNLGFETIVPFAIELEVGKRWGHLEKVFEGDARALSQAA